VVLSQAPTPSLFTDLADYAIASLPRFAVPLFLRVVEKGAMQTTGTNKQQKTTLREQGVDPGKCNEKLYWLKGWKGEGGTDGVAIAYVPFEKGDWEEMNSGRVKL